MRTYCFASLVSLAMLGLSVTGCGSAKVESKDEASAPTTAGEVKQVSAAGLPKLGDPLPPLDGGRLENVAPPEGWQRLEKDSKFLTRFVVEKNSTNPPRIVFTAEDVAGSFADDVTPDNVAAFAEAIAAEQEGKNLVEVVKPILIGDNAFARFVSPAKKGNRSVDRQQLITQFDGRRYILVLEVWAGEEELKKHRDRAYAVAAALKFVKPTADAAAPTE